MQNYRLAKMVTRGAPTLPYYLGFPYHCLFEVLTLYDPNYFIFEKINN